MKLIVASFRANANDVTLPSRKLGLFAAWRLGALTHLTNVRSVAFITSLFAATMPADAPIEVGLQSVAIMTAISIIWYSLVVRLFSSRQLVTFVHAGRHWVDRCAGIAFVGFGAQLAANF